MRTICNPINLSYQYQHGYHSRESADPAVILYKGEYFLFASHGSGYWVSDNLAEWNFIQVDLERNPEFRKFAPAPCVVGDRVYLTHSEGGSILYSDNPKDPDSWVDIGHPYNWNDPAFYYEEDDGFLYLYEGLGTTAPLHVSKFDPRDGMRLVEGPVDLVRADASMRGFERRGHHNEGDSIGTFFEGPWMNKYHGKYYLTYAAPGTEFDTYADGCFVSDSPMGPFTYCEQSPVCWKATGFLRGCGHGCLFADKEGRFWKLQTNSISIHHPFERRISLYPAKFTEDGRLYVNTLRSDYPSLYPCDNPNPFDHPSVDWHLFSAGKQVTASSALEGHEPRFAADEQSSSWWSAETGNAGEWLAMDLGAVYRTAAVQVNFADEDIDETVGGRGYDFCYRYTLEISTDGETWIMLVDRSENSEDMPHDYIQLAEETDIRYLRLTNRGPVPAGGRFAVSGLRVFGPACGPAPAEAPEFRAERCEDTRNMHVEWKDLPDAAGYFVRFGIAPDALYTHYQVVGHGSSADIGCLNVGVTYYVTVDAYNEGGITVGTVTRKV